MLAGPHLVLAHAGGDEGVAFAFLEQGGNCVLRQDHLVFFALEVILHVHGIHHLVGYFVAEWGALFPFGDLLVPFGVAGLDRAGFDHLDQFAEGVFHIAVNGQLHVPVFVVLRAIEIHMHNGAGFTEFLHLAGDAVIKSHAKSEEEIGAIGDFSGIALGVFTEFAAHGPVGVGGAVHAEPAQGEFVILRERAHTHDGGGDRDFGGFGKGPQFLGGFAGDDAAADIEHWALGFLDQTDDFVQLQIVRFRVRSVAGQINFGGPHRLGGLLLNIFRKINDHRAGTAGLGDVKGFLHHARDIADVGDEIAVFHDPEGHAVEIGFLKCTLADHRLRDLAGERDEWCAVHPRISNAGYEVGGAGAAGGHAHAGFAGGAGVALGGK